MGYHRGYQNNPETNTETFQSPRYFSFQNTGLQISLRFNKKEENSEISSFPSPKYTPFLLPWTEVILVSIPAAEPKKSVTLRATDKPEKLHKLSLTSAPNIMLQLSAY